MKLSYRFDGQNNNSARASRFFVFFFAVVARLQRETSSFKVMLHETICNDDF